MFWTNNLLNSYDTEIWKFSLALVPLDNSSRKKNDEFAMSQHKKSWNVPTHYTISSEIFHKCTHFQLHRRSWIKKSCPRKIVIDVSRKISENIILPIFFSIVTTNNNLTANNWIFVSAILTQNSIKSSKNNNKYVGLW